MPSLKPLDRLNKRAIPPNPELKKIKPQEQRFRCHQSQVYIKCCRVVSCKHFGQCQKDVLL